MSKVSFKKNKLYRTNNGCVVRCLGPNLFSYGFVFRIEDSRSNLVNNGTEYSVSANGLHPNNDYSVIGDIEHTNKRSRLY